MLFLLFVVLYVLEGYKFISNVSDCYVLPS